ncbi:hypothetical protein Barb4_05011 [Bacteroidales bacterium Barb4]|nr:hypothetical protein Barb4_05011 [Bacteroidales bacterium Barb4]
MQRSRMWGLRTGYPMKSSYVCPPVKIKKVTHKFAVAFGKRRHGNSKEIQDNKQVYRLSDPAPCLFLFRVRISI